MAGARIFLAALVVAGATAGFAFAGDSPRLELLGPLGHANCDGTTGTGETGDWGFAVFSSPANDTVSAAVSLKNAEPNSVYYVFLIQQGDCFKGIDGKITTNAEGNGSVRVSAPSVGPWAVVDVYGAGVEQEFASQVYEH